MENEAPQAWQRMISARNAHPEAGDIKAMGHPVRFSETPAQIRSEAPEFGQHTEEILQELNFDWDKITELREGGVI